DVPARATPDQRRAAVPRVAGEERALAADHLELVLVDEGGAAVEHREDVVGEAQRAREDPVGASRAVPRLAGGTFRLAAEEPRAADAVAADVEQRAAFEVGSKSNVRLVVERVAEDRAHEA